MLPFGPRERLLCMIAASVQDLDGLGILLGSEAYWDYHHILGHNLLFCATLSAILAGLSTHGKRLMGLVVYFALGHLHLLMDYLGSGPGWAICYWWPFKSGHGSCWLNPSAWAFDGWQNQFAGIAMIAAAVLIGFVARRTPLELLMPELDRKLVGRNGQTAIARSDTVGL